MTLQQLRYVVTVAEVGTITEAAILEDKYKGKDIIAVPLAEDNLFFGVFFKPETAAYNTVCRKDNKHFG